MHFLKQLDFGVFHECSSVRSMLVPTRESYASLA